MMITSSDLSMKTTVLRDLCITVVFLKKPQGGGAFFRLFGLRQPHPNLVFGNLNRHYAIDS